MPRAKMYSLPKYKDQSQTNRKTSKKRRWKKYIILLLITIVAVSLIKVLHYQSSALRALEEQQEQLRDKISVVEEACEELENEQLLLNSLEYIEEVARKEYGMVSPGEKIFVPAKPTP